MSNIIFSTIKYVFKDILLDILRFPIWWYTAGVKRAWKFFIRQSKVGLQAVALKIWFKNLFRPMFGDYSRSGRLISFFVRLVEIFFRTIVFLIWIIVSFILFILWLALPPFVIFMIARQV